MPIFSIDGVLSARSTAVTYVAVSRSRPGLDYQADERGPSLRYFYEVRVQDSLGIVFSFQGDHARPQVTVVSLPLEGVELDPTGEIPLTAHHRGRLASLLKPGKDLIQELCWDSGKGSESHHVLAGRAHEERHGRSVPACRPEQDVPAGDRLRRHVLQHLGDIEGSRLPRQDAFHPGMGVVPEATLFPQGE